MDSKKNERPVDESAGREKKKKKYIAPVWRWFRCTFINELLATLPGDPELAESYVLSKHPSDLPQEDEREALSAEEELERVTTVFSKTENGNSHLWDYQVKGLFKEACCAMIDSEMFTKDELKNLKLTQWTYKRSIDLMVFTKPRIIPLYLPKNAEITVRSRTLRKESMKGGQTAIVRSESAPPGTYIEFAVLCMNNKHEKFIEQWLTYGELHGFGQWRNASHGAFTFEKIEKPVE
jgi:hypothetical protein